MKRIKNKDVTYTGFVAQFEIARSLVLLSRLENGGEFTDSFSDYDWELEKREIFLLSLSSDSLKIHGAAFVERSYGSGGTGKPKFSFSHLLSFGEPITHKELVANDPTLILSQLISSLTSGGNRLQSHEWFSLIAAIKTLRPEISDNLDSLLSLIDKETFLTNESTTKELVLAEQRDGVGVAMDIAGVDRKAIIKTLDPDKFESANNILDLFEEPQIDERSHVEEDAQLIRKLLGEDLNNIHSKVIGWETDRSLVVFVSDKTKFETILGTDLVIYQKHYKSLLLIQYKLMDNLKQGPIKGWSYKLDDQFIEQVTTITNVRDQCLSKSVDKSAWDLRMNSDPYYFKFCERRSQSSREDSLVRGMNVPFELLIKQLKFLSNPDLPSRIGYQNFHRYLNNTEFINLAKNGWIGSNLDSSECIQEIVRKGRSKGRATIVALIDIKNMDITNLRKVIK